MERQLMSEDDYVQNMERMGEERDHTLLYGIAPEPLY
jgi:hypothetical protein